MYYLLSTICHLLYFEVKLPLHHRLCHFLVPLKSLSDSLKGKQGRFRQNLLGKRVDLSLIHICTGEITLPEGTEMVMPGDNVEITVELIYPVALNVGLRFAIREGGRTVGSGQITEILD